jgi:hypothetical protein
MFFAIFAPRERPEGVYFSTASLIRHPFLKNSLARHDRHREAQLKNSCGFPLPVFNAVRDLTIIS